ncbi:MAG: DUF1559 domain-containing protein, partial [Planctomycetota bacterium]
DPEDYLGTTPADEYGFDDTEWRRNFGHGLFALVFPYMEDAALADLVDMTYDGEQARFPSLPESNWTAGNTNVSYLICPTAPTRQKALGITDYGVCGQVTSGQAAQLVQRRVVSPRRDWTGMLQPFRYVNGDRKYFRIRMKHITDGMSKTIMMSEDAGRPLEWIDGRRGDRDDISGARWISDDVEFWIHDRCGDEQLMNCNNNNEIYSFHVGGSLFSFGDGSVRFISEDIDAEVFISALTRYADDLGEL